jgi:hypothetical protein
MVAGRDNVIHILEKNFKIGNVRNQTVDFVMNIRHADHSTNEEVLEIY